MDPGIFNWERGSGVGSERPVELFLWQITSHTDDHVFLNL